VSASATNHGALPRCAFKLIEAEEREGWGLGVKVERGGSEVGSSVVPYDGAHRNGSFRVGCFARAVAALAFSVARPSIGPSFDK